MRSGYRPLMSSGGPTDEGYSYDLSLLDPLVPPQLGVPITPQERNLEITIIIPQDEGVPDVDSYISGGIQIYPGRLTLEQITKLTQEDAYKSRAAMIKRDDTGAIVEVGVSFCNESITPIEIDQSRPYNHDWSGSYFDEDVKAKLSYFVYYDKLSEVPS